MDRLTIDLADLLCQIWCLEPIIKFLGLKPEKSIYEYLNNKIQNELSIEDILNRIRKLTAVNLSIL